MSLTGGYPRCDSKCTQPRNTWYTATGLGPAPSQLTEVRQYRLSVAEALGQEISTTNATMLEWTTAMPLLSDESLSAECSGNVVDDRELSGLDYCARSISGATYTQSE